MNPGNNSNNGNEFNFDLESLDLNKLLAPPKKPGHAEHVEPPTSLVCGFYWIASLAASSVYSMVNLGASRPPFATLMTKSLTFANHSTIMSWPAVLISFGVARAIPDKEPRRIAHVVATTGVSVLAAKFLRVSAPGPFIAFQAALCLAYKPALRMLNNVSDEIRHSIA